MDGAEFDFADFQVEGFFGGAEEAFGVVGEGDVEAAEAVGGGGEIVGGEEVADGEGAVVGGVDELNGRAGGACDGGAEEGVVSAAEDEGIDLVVEEGADVAGDDLVGDGVVEEALFYERHEEGAGCAEDFDIGGEDLDGAFVGTAGNGGSGSDDPDAAVFCDLDGGGGTGGDDALDGDFEDALHARDGEGGRGVAGDDDDFCAFGKEESADLDAVAFDGSAAFSAVGHAGGVTDVKDGFGGENFAKSGDDSEAADAGVKDANGVGGGGLVGFVVGHS